MRISVRKLTKKIMEWWFPEFLDDLVDKDALITISNAKFSKKFDFFGLKVLANKSVNWSVNR